MKYRQSQFDNTKTKEVNQSRFDLSHEFKTQMCFGRYYPVLLEECYPGDEWEIELEIMARFPGLYTAAQQIATYRADAFYCPNKLLFQDLLNNSTNYSKRGWVGFMMGEDVTLPKTLLNINGSDGDGVSNLYAGCSYPIENYLGFPMDYTERLDADKQWSIYGNAMPLSMYLFIYDEYYRNPQWEEPVFFQLGEDPGDNDVSFNSVKQVVNGNTFANWDNQGSTGKIIQHEPFFAHYEKDYFTTARPSPQEGEAIKIPLVDDELKQPHTLTVVNTDDMPVDGALSSNNGKLATSAQFVQLDVQETSATILKLRYFTVLQQYFETAIRAGKGKWRTWIKTFFGRDPEPNAIDIPQLVGSWFGRIQITDTLTTADTSEANTGNYRGNMNLHDGGHKHRYYCPDYGYLMVIINFMPNTSYRQGIHPMWLRDVNTEFPLDMFSGIGDQEIKRKELLAINVKNIWDGTKPNDTIGYQDRFAEAKTRVNRVFNTKEIYDSFYMGQRLSTVEADYDEIDCGQLILGASYPTTNGIREADIFNIQPIKEGASTYVDSTIYAHLYFDLFVKRSLPYFSTPGKQIF